MQKTGEVSTWGKGGGNRAFVRPCHSFCDKACPEGGDRPVLCSRKPRGKERSVSSHRAVYMAHVGNLARPCPWHEASTPVWHAQGAGPSEGAQRLAALTQTSAHSLLLSPAPLCRPREGPPSFHSGSASLRAKLLPQLGTGPGAPWSTARCNCSNGLWRVRGREPKLVFTWNT